MKGPGFRRDLDVRRVWRCPDCGRERRVTGQVTSLRCDCQPEGRWMIIVHDRLAIPRPPTLMVTPEIPVADFQLTAEELAKPLEGRIRRRPNLRQPPEDGKGRPDGATESPELRPSADAQPETQDVPANGPRPKPRKPQRPRRDKPEQGQTQSTQESREQARPVDEHAPAGDDFAAGID